MFYKNEEDAQAVELQNYIKENGPEAAVVKYIGLKEKYVSAINSTATKEKNPI